MLLNAMFTRCPKWRSEVDANAMVMLPGNLDILINLPNFMLRCVFDKSGRYTCACKHNTAGTDCEKCKEFHFDRPWARATAEDANACVGRSTRLFFAIKVGRKYQHFLELPGAINSS